ncbi:MAG TPA: serpin family protein [Phycisphaerae bacterium]|nr:serpin family protein [Phycisphaerae bacterium]HRY70442.1 serpin family protein [Phycisphaerae bacterium]HSA27676.1 serpin family protein [Phycisphaerae bacterium]
MTKEMVRHAAVACLWVALVCTTTVRAETAAAERKSPIPGQPLNANAMSVAKGNAAFGWDLYAQVRTKEGNLAFSPHSISTALAMTYAGASGQTAEQMARVLHFELAKGKVPPAFADLAMSLNAAGKDTHGSLDIANALWGQQGEPFLNPFLGNNNEFFGAGFRQVDFAKSTEQARGTINAWVAEKTKDKIKELLQKEDGVRVSTRRAPEVAGFGLPDRRLWRQHERTKHMASRRMLIMSFLFGCSLTATAYQARGQVTCTRIIMSDEPLPDSSTRLVEFHRVFAPNRHGHVAFFG